jgi:transposase
MVKCSKRQVRELKTALRWKLAEAQRQRIQMVLLRESGLTQPAIAEAMGVSLSTVNRAHMAYDQGGIKALKPRPCGGRKRENMTVAEEKALLARFAKAAGAGEMLNIHDLKRAYEQQIGHKTSSSTVYDLLGRHGWRKLMPRPFHPQQDLAAQNGFKKNGFSRAVKRARQAAERRGRRPRIMYADEARFGRMNRPRPRWAPAGIRPKVASQLIREYIYLYGAVAPKDGTCVYLIMPTSNTACFQAFLDVLSRKFARQDILLVLDGAPNHRSGQLVVPENITLLFLPPYSPELNPKENLWDEIREKIFKNYALKSIDHVRQKLNEAILYVERNPDLVKSITSFPYIAKSF